jgi:membrane-bound metal-dependent hydrolase YbcI (DUF457 family)
VNKRGHVTNAVLLSIGIGILREPTVSLAAARSIAEVFVPVILGALFPDVDTAFGKHRKTLHNLPVLAIVLAYPLFFENLQFVWIGVLTHYVLDIFGSKRGIALFYPFWDEEYGFPIGVTTSSKWAGPMTVAVTAFELTVATGIVLLAPPEALDLGAQIVGLQ